MKLDLLDSPFDGRSLIEASAGTGKTWTLTALYARLLLERQLSVGQILVVTYTTAATAELRERIRDGGLGRVGVEAVLVREDARTGMGTGGGGMCRWCGRRGKCRVCCGGGRHERGRHRGTRSHPAR